jgi:hypothetical protein
MKIREISSVSSHAPVDDQIPLFLSELWSSSAGEGYKRYGIFSGKKEDKLAGAFALFHYGRLGKKIHITPPAAPSIGLFLTEKKSSLYAVQTLQKRALRCIAEFLVSNFPKDHVDIALPPNVRDIQPFQELEFEIKVSYTYLLNLKDTFDDELLKAMSPERRKNIRDGAEQDFTVEFDADPTLVMDLIKSTLTEQGITFHRELFQNLLSTSSDSIFSIGVFRDNQIVSAVVVGSDHETAYYLAGGTKKNQSIAGPYALWNAILRSKSMGLEKFDFMGSSVPSIERYFRGFGGELTPYFRVRRNTSFIDLIKSTKDRFR